MDCLMLFAVWGQLAALILFWAYVSCTCIFLTKWMLFSESYLAHIEAAFSLLLTFLPSGGLIYDSSGCNKLKENCAVSIFN